MKNDIKIFPDNYPQDFLDLENRFISLYKDVDKIMSVADKFYLPVNTVHTKIKELDQLVKDFTKLQFNEEIIELFKLNLIERANGLKIFLERKLDKKFRYMEHLSRIGIDDKDIQKYKKEVEDENIQNKIESFLPEAKSIYQRSAITEEEQQEGKDLLFKILNISFELSPQKLRETYSSFENYIKTVEFIRNTDIRSHHYSGRVNLNLSHLQMIEVIDWHSSQKILDSTYAADLVGEEGLLGHQGQFILTEKSNIPTSMKRSETSTRINVEALGRLGTNLILEEIKKGSNGIDTKNFDLLLKNFELFELSRKIRTLIACYADYLLIQKRVNIKRIGKEITKLTGEPYYVSDLFMNRAENILDTEFWKDWHNRIDYWTYVAADSLAKDITRRLSSLDDEARRKILEYLYVGYWSRNSFMKYLDFLIKKFS